MALATRWTVMSAKSTNSPQLTWDKPPLSILESVRFLLKTDFLLVLASVPVLSLGGCDSFRKGHQGYSVVV